MGEAHTYARTHPCTCARSQVGEFSTLHTQFLTFLKELGPAGCVSFLFLFFFVDLFRCSRRQMFCTVLVELLSRGKSLCCVAEMHQSRSLNKPSGVLLAADCIYGWYNYIRIVCHFSGKEKGRHMFRLLLFLPVHNHPPSTLPPWPQLCVFPGERR